MQGLWYGDRRDRVKWGALLYLAKTRGIPRILQVAYYRDGTDRSLETTEGRVPLPEGVWEHFSSLRQIKRLGRATGTKIIVLDEPFDPLKRDDYTASVVRRIRAVKSPKIVFLDPDTGIEPASARPEHVAKVDLVSIWAALSKDDILAAYQHAGHTRIWRTLRARKMSEACGGVPVHFITGTGMAADVAMLWSAWEERQKMATSMTVSELFKEADLSPCGPVPWRIPLSVSGCGVYVVAFVRNPRLGCGRRKVEYLPPDEQKLWLQKQPIVYIGQTKRPLAVRIREFYRHKYGEKRPHRGGQAVKLLRCALWIYWAQTNNPRSAERMMINAFVERVGGLPFANRRR